MKNKPVVHFEINAKEGYRLTACGLLELWQKIKVGDRKATTCKSCKKTEIYKNKYMRVL